MKKLLSLFYSLVLLAGLSSVAKAADPIRVPVLNWSSQIVMANVLDQVWREMGYEVELVPAESVTRYEALRVGELHVAHETWQGTMALPFYEAMDRGGVIDTGNHPALTHEEMGVPNWVIEQNLCPGLPNWEAMKSDECVKNFVTADSDGKGRWLEGPIEWHGNVIPERLEALGLSDKWMVKFAGSADALWAELAAAKKEGRGTVIFNWTPNFTDYEGFTMIEFPPFYQGCRIEDGGNMETAGCGSPVGWLKKGAHIKFPITHPSAYKFYSKMGFSSGQIGEMANYRDNLGMSHAEAATTFIEAHRAQIDEWMQ
jgi:glycine betaine/proline transport system substrate-binding protein